MRFEFCLVQKMVAERSTHLFEVEVTILSLSCQVSLLLHSLSLLSLLSTSPMDVFPSPSPFLPSPQPCIIAQQVHTGQFCH